MDTLFPYTTRFRSRHVAGETQEGVRLKTGVGKQAKDRECGAYAQPCPRIHGSLRKVASPAGLRCRRFGARPATSAMTIRARIASTLGRSEERRVGKECVSTGRSRW